MTTTTLSTTSKTTKSKVETHYFATRNFLTINSYGSKEFYKAGDRVNAAPTITGLADCDGYGVYPFTLISDNGETTKAYIPWAWVKARKFQTIREYTTTEIEIHE